MKTSAIRVLVADDHLIIRRGLATLLLAFSDLVMVGEAQNGIEALERCAECQPDVVLMGLLMPEIDSVIATRRIRERYPNIQVIVLTRSNEYDIVQRTLAAGATGYLLPSANATDLATAIRAAHAACPSAAVGCFEDMAHIMQPATLALGSDLTEREREVLELMRHGLTNTQIGAQLAISRATAKAHVSNILSKLDVASRTEAVALAVERHLTNGLA